MYNVAVMCSFAQSAHHWAPHFAAHTSSHVLWGVVLTPPDLVVKLQLLWMALQAYGGQC